MKHEQQASFSESISGIAEAMRVVAANHEEGAKANALERSIAEIASAVAVLAHAVRCERSAHV